ncbi:MAG: NEW3 domain-containing protein [Xanthobacteraceae bacterium]|uniref:COG1470 family protein n=1 Tax=Pseudolabrys sp. TaxID=1960880 RepID=UPI003D0FA71E
MLNRLIASLAVLSVVSATAIAAHAADSPPGVKGIYLVTDYPAVSVQAGTTATVALQLRNFDHAPERFALSVDGVPKGWTATLLGGGQPVAAAMPSPDSSVSFSLRLDIPKDATAPSAPLTVRAQGAGGTGETIALPINVTLAKQLPAKLSLNAQLPELRGTARSSFDYTLSVKNDSGKKLLVGLAADAPRNFDVQFTEAYGTQQLTAVPVDAGQSKDIKLKVTPPDDANAGSYAITAHVAAGDAKAQAAMKLDLTGEPNLSLAGRNGILSARAVAGRETSIPIIVSNGGTAPAEHVKLSGTAPSGWKITFEPAMVDRIAPNQHQEVQALLTPTIKTIAGDYVTAMRADARGNSGSANFRVTVSTSTVWGAVGAGIVGIALLLMVGAVARFGRR